MPPTSHHRGHPTVYLDQWRYADTGELVEGNERPCVRCGEMPTEEGHDACLGTLDGVKSACCGHGVEAGYIVGVVVVEEITVVLGGGE